MDSTGMEEMQRLMRTWTGRRQEREKEVMEAHNVENTMTVDKPVENVVRNTVETFIKKFDKPSTDLGSNNDFDSWKRRRTGLLLTVDSDLGHGLRGRGEQGVGSDVNPNIENPHGVSEMEVKGLKLKSNIVTNHNHCSKYGGDSGVQRDGGGQGDGGVIPVQFSNKKQRDPRRVGSFPESGSTPDNAAAAVGKPV